VVCRKNPNSKVIWELISSSSPGQCGSAHMMAGVSLGHQHSTPTQQFLPASFVTQYLPISSSQQFLPVPPVAPMLGSSSAPALGGAYWLS